MIMNDKIEEAAEEFINDMVNQRDTSDYSQDVKNKVSPYDVRLCKIVMGEDLQLWNNAWLKTELTNNFPQPSIVNKETLAKVTPVITFRETRAYNEFYEEECEPNVQQY